MSKKQRQQELERLSPISMTNRTKRISEDEAAYLAKVMQGAQEAERLLQEADALDQQAGQKRQQAVALLGAKDSWVDHLFEKFGLDRRTDSIDIDTREIRRMQVLDAKIPSTDEPATPVQD